MTTRYGDSFYLSGGRFSNRSTSGDIYSFDTETKAFSVDRAFRRSRHSHVAFLVPNCCTMIDPIVD